LSNISDTLPAESEALRLLASRRRTVGSRGRGFLWIPKCLVLEVVWRISYKYIIILFKVKYDGYKSRETNNNNNNNNNNNSNKTYNINSTQPISYVNLISLFQVRF